MSRERVLLVDDDLDLLGVMNAHLARQGFVVQAMSDPRAALDCLGQGEPFAVLVTDLDMAAMHGLELLRAARGRDPRLEVIVVTGNGTLDVAVKAMRHDGAYDFLIKPFETLNVLSLAVARAAGHRQLLIERAALSERLNALLTHTGDAILSADDREQLVVVNPAAARLLGRDDLVGRPAAESLPKPLASLLANWRALGQSQLQTVEIAGPGQAQWLVNLAPIPGQGWVMILRDVTLLERLDDARFQLLSEAATRLQVPLAQAIGNMAELDALVGAKDPRAAAIIFRQTGLWERIQHWMIDLLELVRVESGTGLRSVEIEVEPRLREILANAHERVIREKRLRLKLAVAADLPRARLDLTLLRVLVQGLVGWAAQRSDTGGEVRLSASAQGGQLVLEVADSGPPLDDTDLTRLFARSGGGADGSGLELALVKSAAARLGGQVWARRQTAGGAITVLLSLAPPLADPDDL